MNQREKIISSFKQQNEIARQMEALKTHTGLFSYFKKRRLQKEFRRLDIKNKYLIREYLEGHDSEYKQLMKSNYALLEKNPLTFKVYAETYIITGTYTTEMAGSIHDNGYAYCEAMEANYFPIFQLFAKYQFPKRMAGTVDYLGRINLYTVETDLAMWKRIPKVLKGAVHDGKITLTTTERDYEIFTGGAMCMSKMIADFFGNDETARSAFFNNADKMRDLIDDFRKSIVI